jgi:hypothetical protein
MNKMKRISMSLLFAALAVLIGSPIGVVLSANENVSVHENAQHEAKKGGKSKRKCCKRGPTGPKGPQGPTGPTGPAGENFIINSAVYGSFFTTFNATVMSGSPILFTAASDANLGVSLDPTGGIVSLNEPGDYLVIYGVSTAGSPGNARYALALNGVVFADGSNSDTLFSILGDPQMSTVSTTVRVPPNISTGTLSVINFGSDLFILASETVGDLTAFITVKKLNSTPITFTTP